MAGRPKTERLWCESFDLEAEITALIERIETCTNFTLPDRKREIVLSYAATKLNDTKQAHVDANGAGRRVSTSRRNYLTTIQDAIFLIIPNENVALMPLTEYVLNDPSYYEDAMHRAASLTEDELFMALSPVLKDITVQEARDRVSKIWHEGVDDNARKYAEALKRPDRERMPISPGQMV